MNTTKDSYNKASMEFQAPAGFQQADTDVDQYLKWDWDQVSTLQGIVIKVKEVTVSDSRGMDRDVRFAVVEVDGEAFNLWESANLKDLFNNIQAGNEIHVTFTGMKTLPGLKSMRTFKAFWK